MKMKNIVISTIAALTTLSLLSACKNSNSGKEVNIKVTSLVNKPLANVDVQVNGKSSKTYTTNNKGEVTVKVSDPSTIELSKLPLGYYKDKTIEIDGSEKDFEIKVPTKVIQEEEPFGQTYSIGDVIYDFSFTDCDGVTHNLAETLKTKDMVLINCWATHCGPCVSEFAFMEEAYENYKDSVEIFALSNSDTNKKIKTFQTNNELTFPMGFDENNHLKTFNPEQTIPTSVVVDRYGMITTISLGSLASVQDFTELFDRFIGEFYVPSLAGENGKFYDDPDVTMPPSSEFERVCNGENFNSTYQNETNPEDADKNWPWIISEDGQSMRPSNSRHANTFSIIYTSVTLGPDQVFAFDYLADTEYGCDVLYILIDRKIVQQISGQSPDWETCYCYVPLEQETHEVAFAYFKDNAANAGKDTVYVKNLRVISTDRIDKPSLFYHDAYYGYSAELNTYLHYVDVVLNEDDGYYHVNSKEGPYLLANVQNSSGFSNTSILEYTGVGDPNNIDASWRNALKGYSTLILQYASYQNNSEVGLVPVTEELHLALVNIMKTISNNGDNEWLEVCGFLSAYARDNITDPIKGLAPFSAYEGQLGENYVNFNRLIMPRGLYTRFIPETSGVYTFYSITDTNYETICWLYDEDLNLMAESDFGERYYMMVEKPDPNCAVYAYLEAGKPYYISMAYANLNVFGDLPFVIEFLDATEYTIFTLASPNIYTTLLDENGEMTQNVIAGGIDVALGDDGYYHHLKEDGSLGSILYCDFEYGTGLFDSQGAVLSIKDMILYGAFDLYFRDDDGNLIKHVDRTEDIRPYISQMITEGDAKGTVMVTEELAEILQEMMDCYIFNGVEHQWTKLCYYFKTISK